jgi:hypothetical protein
MKQKHHEEVPEVASPAPVLLHLDAPRVITLKSARGEFKYKTRRVTLKDWERCFQSIVDQSMRVDGEFQKVFDNQGALVELADQVLLDVDPSKLPVSHRLAVGSALQTAVAMDPEKELFDVETVNLAAIWTTEGESRAFEGLVHHFHPLSLADIKKFRFESVRVRVKGDGKNSVTVYPSRLAIAMKMYDDLIESVEGYAVGGAPLTSKADIVREMDGAPKAAAALHLFTRDSAVEFE